MSYIGAQIVNFRPSDDRGWTLDAACAYGPEDLMFPTDEDHAGIAAAKIVCAGCPVTEACLSDALNRNERFGIRGGTTPDERRSMKRAAANRRARSK